MIYRGTIYRIKDLMEDKVYSLASLVKFGGSPFKLLKLLEIYLAKRGNLIIRILDNNILVNKDNIHGLLRLLRILNKCNINEVGINLFTKDHLSVDEIMNNEYTLQLLKALCIAKRLGTKVEDLGNEVLVDLFDTKWLVRKSVAFWDLMQGPLLPYSLEPYEYYIWFNKNLSHVSCFIDIGANIGGYTIRACKNSNFMNTYSFEPDLENYGMLIKNLQLNDCDDKVKVYNVALGDSNSIMPLYQPDSLNMGSLSLCRKGILRGYVIVKPLDEILNLESGCMVKIDVEGFELRVLRGMVNNLGKVKFLMVETSEENAVTRFLKQYGFKLIDRHGINYFYQRK